jgi:hypothetical protein
MLVLIVKSQLFTYQRRVQFVQKYAKVHVFENVLLVLSHIRQQFNSYFQVADTFTIQHSANRFEGVKFEVFMAVTMKNGVFFPFPLCTSMQHALVASYG